MSQAIFHNIERVLRRRSDPALRIGDLLPLIVACALAHGACVGSFGLTESRYLQVVYSSLKLPLMIVATFLLSVPPFFVLHSLLGLRSDFLPAMRAILTAQAGFALALASTGPLLVVFYTATSDYHLAIMVNGILFLVALAGSMPLIFAGYRPLIASNPVHRRLLWAWLGTYMFVGIQMGWILRPFIGSPGSAITFFRAEQMDNAYIAVLRVIWNAVQ